jgi:ribosomal protein L29
MELEKLLTENVLEPVKYNFAENLLNEIEAEYTGKSTVRIDRQKEREELEKELALTKKALKSIKNIKTTGSSARRGILNLASSEKRKELRRKIARIKVLLDEIAIEDGEKNEKRESTNPVPPPKIKWGSTDPYDF